MLMSPKSYIISFSFLNKTSFRLRTCFFFFVFLYNFIKLRKIFELFITFPYYFEFTINIFIYYYYFYFIIRYKYTFGTQTFSKSSMWYPNFRNVQFGTSIF